MSVKIFKSKEKFKLECGEFFSELEIAYHTFGKLSPAKDNIIWVCHALTANSDVDEWWPNVVCKDKFLDPNKYFIVCANILGSHYGSTSPLSVNPSTNKPYFGSFPQLTMRDVVKAHIVLANYLGISRVKAIIGASIGGFQVVEWLVMCPNFAEKAVLIATAAKAEAWVIALNESQRMAIECDSTFGELSSDAGARGLSVARSIALLSYRGQSAYNLTQTDSDLSKINNYMASSYQRYQGEKLVKRFNAYSYHIITKLTDSHNVGRGRGGVESALATIKSDVAIIAISSDILYPISSNEVFRDNIPNSKFYVIESDYGHDGFLIEHEKLNNIISKHLRGSF